MADLKCDYNRGSAYFCGKLNQFVSGMLKRELDIWHHSVLKRYFDDLGEVAG